MSVATEFPPVVDIPERARRTQRGPQGAGVSPAAPRLATVTILHRASAPSRPRSAPAARSVARPVAAPVRLTRRGLYVVAAAVALLAVGLVWVARLSAPSAAPASRPVPDTVTVRAGDTLWSLAARLAPQSDPRAEIAELQRVNRLSNVALVPGQVLRTH